MEAHGKTKIVEENSSENTDYNTVLSEIYTYKPIQMHSFHHQYHLHPCQVDLKSCETSSYNFLIIHLIKLQFINSVV